ncbi:hypothetical protein BGAL_0629g00020 [Botrytis galanthina]|uniref:Uncharacterized protein n=1 Tax=Botrytis galanthina TaxID=278940 RepID=A0A4S8QUW4_9HELO|nr:hypothetical protein BGAL_0629g00020 [Botrytis galanthina]
MTNNTLGTCPLGGLVSLPAQLKHQPFSDAAQATPATTKGAQQATFEQLGSDTEKLETRDQ